MIKPEELRIGNVIETQDLGPWHETIVTPQTMELMYLAPETYRGIPLTEEWLVKFGFKKNGQYHSWIKQFHKRHNNYDFLVVCLDGEAWIQLENRSIKPYREMQSGRQRANYIHQLQNLWYALTGEELKLA